MVTREMFLKGFMRVDLKDFKEMVEKAKEVAEKIEAEERDIFDQTVIYFQFSKSDRPVLKLKIYDNENRIQEFGEAEILEYTIEGEYRDIDAVDVIKIDEFIKTVCEYTSDKVIYLFFSIKKVIVNLDDRCLLIY